MKASDLAHPVLEITLVLAPTCSLTSLFHASVAIIFLSWYNNVEVTIQLPQTPVSSFVPSSQTSGFPSEKLYSSTRFRRKCQSCEHDIVTDWPQITRRRSVVDTRGNVFADTRQNEHTNMCLQKNAQLYSTFQGSFLFLIMDFKKCITY